MSRRKRRVEAAPRREDARDGGRGLTRRILRDVGILVGVFAVTVAVAELVGAANLGVSFGVGEITFAIAVVVLLSRG